MKLLYTGNSPYARRPRMAIRQAGLLDQVEERDITPRDENLDELLAAGPGGKVPVLVTDTGESLCESLIISRYLDALSGGALYPKGDKVAAALEVESLASVLMDALFWRNRENQRVDEETSPGVIKLEAQRAARVYGALDDHATGFSDTLDMPTITVVASLGYADWRHPDDNWRAAAPKLAQWYERVAQQAVAQDTAPVY